MEAQDGFTLSFLGENNREALNICGTLSGREVNKVEQAGFLLFINDMNCTPAKHVQQPNKRTKQVQEKMDLVKK